MKWKQIREIARWEYLQKVRSRGFIVSLILFPVFMLLLGLLPSILMTGGPSSRQTIGIVDPTGEWADVIESALASRGETEDGVSLWELREYPADEQGVEEATGDALREEIKGFIEVVDATPEPDFLWKSTNLADMQTAEAVQGSLREVVRSRRVRESGIDPETAGRITAPVEVMFRKLSEEGESDSNAGMEFIVTFFSAFIGIMLFMLLILTTGQTLVRGLVEEKSNRIMEILVGTTRPTELMWGKLLGLSALGLTQVAAWGVLGGAVFLYISGSTVIPPELLSSAVEPLPLVLVYLILGYLFYSSLFIGAGSLVTTEQEAQYVTQYITMLIALPLAFSVVVMQDPNAPWVEGLSYVPFLTPALMMLRVVAADPGPVTILGTTGILLVSTIGITWIASKIFRTAILLYGKRPSLREVMRWLRE